MAAVVVVLIAVAFAVTSLTKNHLYSQIDHRLATAARLRALAAPEYDDSAPHNVDRLSSFYEGVFQRDGGLMALYPISLETGRQADTPDLSLDEAIEAARSKGPITTGSEAGGSTQWRLRIAQTRDGTLVVIGLPLDDVTETIRRLIAIEVIATTAIVVVLGAVSWWVIRLGIRPVKQMTATATTIAAGDLSQRVTDASPSTEAGQLGLAINHMMEQLEGSFNERSASQERLQQFVADASHELRTPVTTIRGYAELYRLGGLPDGERLSEAMRRTEQEAVRMSRLVDDMLTIAKLGAGRPLDQRPVDLAKLVADAATDARVVAPDREITVDAPSPVIVTGDEDRLRQVLANIVGNALIHTPPGTAINLRASAAGDRAELAVTDHGPGMRPEVAAKVTERFYRADPGRARAQGGSGLGMAIVDATVNAHGGAVSVISQLGAGTTVRVALPISPPAAPPLPHPSVQPLPSVGGPTGGPPTLG